MAELNEEPFRRQTFIVILYSDRCANLEESLNGVSQKKSQHKKTISQA